MLRGMLSRLCSGLAAALVVVAALGLAACQSGTSRTSAGSPFRADLEKICNALSLSGADRDQTSQRTYIMAQWLNSNITSAEGHAFLIDFARLGEDKAARVKKLEDTARQLGLPSCPLAAQWK